MKKKIPLQCFNPRFFKDSDVAAPIQQPLVRPPEPGRIEYGDGIEEDLPALSVLEEDVDDDDDYEEMDANTVARVRKLELATLDEITFYEQLRKACDDLTGLYAMPEWKENALQINRWSSSSSDGLALACMSLYSPNLSEEDASAIVFDGIRPTNADGDVQIKRICDNLHITDATMESTFVSHEMCEFRGELMATIIKVILVRRVCQNMILSFVQQFEKQISDLLEKSYRARTFCEASLKITMETSLLILI